MLLIVAPVEVVFGFAFYPKIDLGEVFMTVRAAILTRHELNRGGFDLVSEPQGYPFLNPLQTVFALIMTVNSTAFTFPGRLKGHIEGANLLSVGDRARVLSSIEDTTSFATRVTPHIFDLPSAVVEVLVTLA